MSDWGAWVATVLSIAQARGINVSVTYPGPGLATFTWVCRNGTRNGVAGAGESMIHLTTPDQFTALWNCAPFVQPPPLPAGVPPPVPGSPAFEMIDRRGRFVPRVAARAVARALEVLF